MPSENFEFLSYEVKKLKKESEECRSLIKKSVTVAKIERKNLISIMNIIELEFRRAFIKSMAILYGDYLPFTFKIDGVTYFNQNSFISTRSPSDLKFYEEFLQSQNFKQFLQFSMNHAEYDFYFYFENLCGKYRYYLSMNSFHIDHPNKNGFDWNSIFFKTNKSHSDKKLKSIIDIFKSDAINLKNLNSITEDYSSKLEKLSFLDSDTRPETAKKKITLLPFFLSKINHKNCDSQDNSSLQLIKNNVNNSEKLLKDLFRKIFPEEKLDFSRFKILDVNFNFKVFDKLLLDFPTTINNYNLNDNQGVNIILDSLQSISAKLNLNSQNIPSSSQGNYNSTKDVKSPSKKLHSQKFNQTNSSYSPSENHQYDSENQTMIRRQLTLLKEKREIILQENEVKETPMSYMATASIYFK